MFKFSWPSFTADFNQKAKDIMEEGLNKGPKPTHISSAIRVKQLELGTIPPDLEILEIGELDSDRFKGLFRLTYAGDAFVVLHIQVQVNPLSGLHANHAETSSLMSSWLNPNRNGFISAHKPLILPMQLKISRMRLRGVIALVVDRQKGVTLTFKNDPLTAVDVASTFDDMASVKSMLQSEIETQLRNLFVTEIPSLVHTYSLEYFGIVEFPDVEHELMRREEREATTVRLRQSKENITRSRETLVKRNVIGSLDSGMGGSFDDMSQVRVHSFRSTKAVTEICYPLRTGISNPPRYHEV